MKERGFSHVLISFLLCLLTFVPLSASVDIGWEGVSFGLLVNKYQEELTTIRFVELLGDSSLDSMNISNGKDIKDPQFRMDVSTNVLAKANGFIPIKINLKFEPFSLESSKLSYDAMVFVDGTPVKFGEGTSALDTVHVSEETTVSFSPKVSPDGATWTYQYLFGFSFVSETLEGAVAGTYSCNLIAEVVSIT